MTEIFNFDEKIHLYNKYSKESLVNEIFPEEYNLLLWHVNSECNFKCDFCNAQKTKAGHIYRTPQEIESAFRRTERKWFIFISSLGEPFLYPKFLEILSVLTKNNYIALNTNLTQKTVYELPKYVDINKVLAIHAAYHVIELEKIKSLNAKQEFIKKVHFLEDNNIEVIVSYIAYPPLLNRIKDDFEYLKSNGLNKIMAKPFVGVYENKVYPNAYTKEQWQMIQKISTSINSVDFLDMPDSFTGRICDAGNRSFFLNQKGILFRCGSSEVKLADFFNIEGFVFPLKVKPCECTKHNCKFECVMNSKNVKQSLWAKILNHV